MSLFFLGPVHHVNQSMPSLNPPPATLQTIMAPTNVDGGVQNIGNIVSSEHQVAGETLFRFKLLSVE